MKIIISPAKRMKDDIDFMEPRQLPVFLEKAEQLKNYLRTLSQAELKELLCCNNEIAALNFERYQKMELCGNTVPAVLSFDGIQYQYMAPQIFTYEYFDYIETRLRILSGFYGILRPLDGVVPYRLELDAKLKTPFCKNLYDYWSDSVFRELTREDDLILNLASKQYSRIIKKYITPGTALVTCIFGEQCGGKIREKGVYVKMARGEMVRFMAENAVESLEDIKSFNRLGFSYHAELSDKETFVFLMERKISEV